MSGRKGAITKENLKNVICKYKDTFQASIPPVSDHVYVYLQQELRVQFNCNMTAKAIQMYVKRHKNYLFDAGYTELNVREDNVVTDFHYVTFQMSLAEYLNVVPKDSIYRLLPNKWTNELQDQIFFKTDIVCTFAFKYSYVPTDVHVNDIRCTGSCTQCDAKLSLNISAPTGDCVTVTCEIRNYNINYPHDRLIKNRLTSERVKQLKKELKYAKALKVQHAMADEVMTMNDTKEPTTFPNLDKLRKMRHEARSALHFHKNIILSLYAMAHCIPYDSFIRKISLVPFFIYFWTEEQNQYYNEVLKNSQKILSIDATGSLFTPIEPPSINDFLKYRSPKHLFLYAVVAYTPNFSVPISYMASESHTMETIATWLTTWQIKKELPNEIVSDDSSALLGAITKVFLKTDLNSYIKQCFDLLEGITNEVPLCYVRMDKSHFVKKLYKQSCFDKTSEKTKFFYINCLRLIQKLICYEKVKSVIRDIVILALHEFRCSDLNDSQSKCGEAFERLNLEIVNHRNYDNAEDTHTDIEIGTETELVSNENDQEVSMPIIQFCDDLIQTEKLYLQLAEPSYEKNEYFLPELLSTLKRLLKKIPLWGCIMNKYFKGAKEYASSSNVESHFKDLKTIYFDTKNKRVRLDEFLVRHHTFANGAIKLSSRDVLQKINSKAQQTKQLKIDSIKRVQQSRQTKPAENKRAKLGPLLDSNDFEAQSVFQDNPVEIENWRGLAVSTSRSLKPKPIYILQNGNVANSKVTEKRLIITNTCAFDSVAQTFAIAYKDRQKFKDSVDTLTNTGDVNNFILLVRELSNAKQNTKKLYELREILLLKIFKPSDILNIVDCSCNTTKILEEICTSSLFVSAFRRRLCSNGMCPSHADGKKLL